MSKPIEYVNLHGKPVDFVRLQTTVAPPPGGAKERPAQYHKGWRVEGHPPGSLEAAKRQSDKAWAEWTETPPEKRAERFRDHSPTLWDEQKWRRTAKKKAVQSRPFFSHSAAVVCVELAISCGWIDVVVVELKKGQEL